MAVGLHASATHPRAKLVALAVASCFAGAVQANPVGPTVMHGTASFNAVGNAFNITNSPNAIINWQGFSIGASQITRFIQNSAASSVLNRVTGAESSSILGQLLSNGRVLLINPNGVFIGGGAVVDVAGFTTSSLKISDADFLAGKFKFTDQVGAARIVNQGIIRTSGGGQVHLIAPGVENSGVIASPGGQVILAAGKTVELVDSGSPYVRVEFTAPDHAAVNVGQIVADAGSVGIYGTTIKHSGVVRANSAQAGANGRIVFKATKDVTLDAGSRLEANGPSGGNITVQAESGTLLASGIVEARGENDKGGNLQLLGTRVGLIGNARVDASGDKGGGTVLVGGDFQGRKTAVQNAQRTYVGPDTTIRADALSEGDGGKVIVWSEDTTRAYGTITARGGTQGGDGGFIEVSGKNFLDFSARVDASAPRGAFGTLLLDPADIVVATGGSAAVAEVDAFADTGTTVTISPTTLNNAAATVVLQATNDITVSNPVTLATAGKHFVAQAGRDININAAVTTNGGNIHLEADSPHSTGGSNGVGIVKVAAAVSTLGSGATGGAVTLIGGADSNPSGGFDLTADVNAGTGGISLSLTNSGTFDLGIGAGGSTQLASRTTDFLKTTGALVLGQATTAGSDGLGSGALTLKVNSITNSTSTPIELSAQSGSSFQLIAGAGGILLDKPLTTYQDTVISTTGTLTINQTLATSDSNLTLTAGSVVLGGSGSVNIGSGTCTGTACTTLGVDTSQIFWDGEAGDGNWFNAQNWRLSSTDPDNVLPDLTRDVTIDAAQAGTIQIGTGGAALAKSLVTGRPVVLSSGSLELANASTFSDSLTFSGGTLQGAGGVVVGGASGALTWSGGTAATSAGTFLLASGHSGTLSNALSLNRLLQNDGTLTLNAATITGTGSITNNGTLTATGTNSVSKMLLALGSIGGAGSLTVNDWSRTGGVFNMTGNASLSVPTGNFIIDQTYSAGNLTLSSTGAVTQTAAIAASGLELLGTGGSYTLTNTGNTVTTLAANTGSVSYTDSNALSVGSVNATTGINATGLVDVRTQTGDLTLSNAIATTSTSASAVTLVADVAATPDATGTGGNFKNAGSAAITTGTGGAWRIYTGNPTGTTRGGLVEAGKRYNVDNGSDPIGSGKRIYFRIQPTLTLTADNKSKTYGDANPSFTVGVSGTLLDGDTQGAAITGAPSFAVGGSTSTSGQLTAGTVHSITPSAAASGLGYSFTYADGTLTVNQKGITGSITADNKVYNANDSATIATRTLGSGVISGDTVSYTGGTATFDTKNVGTGKTVTATGLSLSGADLGNYTVNATATATANITAANLAVTGVTAANKVYDANTAATLGGVAAVTALGTDALTLGGTGSGSFANKNVGNTKAVAVTGYTLGGTDAGNYTLVQPAGLTANITAANLAVTGVTAANKVYDATTAATLGGVAAVTALGSDALTLGGTGSGTFANKNVGNGKAVSITGYTLGGTDAGNYTLVQPAGLTANITAAAMTVSGITAANKVYDATTAATVNTAGAVYTGLIGSDAVSVSATGTFANKSVGNSKTVTLASTYAGADAGNYTITSQANTTANITTANLAVTGVTASNKVYDATSAATLGGVAAVTVLGSDALTLGGTGSGAFANKNVGNGKPVTVTGYTLGGGDAGNYTLVQPAGLTANITAAAMTVSGITAANKVYDATTAATVNTAGAVYTGLIGSDAVSVSATGTFANKNVGNGKTVTLASTYAGADAGNYTITSQAGTTANITAANLAVTGVTAANKVYDATTAATLGGVAAVTALGGDAVLLGGTGSGAFANKNVGNAKAVTVTGYTLSGGDAGNYTLVQPAGVTADITGKTLTVTGFTAQNKVYDATTAATVSGGSIGGVLGGDTVSLTGLTGSFANKNVGTGKTVSVSGGTLTGTDAGNYQLTSGSGSTTANITAATVAATGFTVQNKVYDATTAATVSSGTLGGVLGGDAVSLAALSGSFANKNVGTAKSVAVSGGALTGADAGNYQLSSVSGSTTADITPATLTTTGFTAQNKVYDATTAATVSGGTLGGVLGGDAVSLTGLTGSFANKNVGTGKTVTVSGGTLSGTDAGNYQLAAASGTTAANITPATLTATGFTAQNKVYDATTAATVSGGLGGVFSGDVVSLTGLSGSFANKNVGTGKTVTVSGGTLSGTDAGNYQLGTASGSATANITPATLTLSGFTAQNKVYDATTAAAISGGALGGVFSGDVVSISGISGNFANKNVGTGKTVTVSGGTLTGADAGNYQLSSASGSATADITPATLTATGFTAQNKVYDATTAATVSGGTLGGVFSADAVSLAGLSGSFANKNVGTGKTVTVSGGTLTGTDAGNYQLAAASGTTTANITPATLTATGLTAQNKVYDATTAATVSGGTLGGVFSGDVVSLSGISGSFADKNVGTGKTVTVSGGALAGADAGNYQLSSASGNTTANITPATLLITAATNAKTYDGNISASATPAVSGLRGGDTASGLTEVYSDPDVGAGKTLLVSGYTVNDGAGGANYKVTLVNDTTGVITQATATLITESLSPVQLAINSTGNQINISATTVDEGTRITPIKAINEGARVTPVKVGTNSKDDANLPSCN